MMRRGGGGQLRQKRMPAQARKGMGGWGAGGRFGGARGHAPGGMPGSPQPDYFGQLNAFQADIGGEQPGPISAGWGGAGGGLGTMGMTKVNSWLNTFQDPIERARAMNGIGYFNQGNPYDAAVARGNGLNRGYRAMAQGNQAAGAQGYTAPGTYLHQSGGYGAGPGVAPDLNFGGYIGATQVSDDGSARYSPLAPRGRTRRTRTFGDVMY